MSEPAAKNIPSGFTSVPAASNPTRQRIIFLAALFFIAQFLLVYLLGTKKQNVPRAVTHAPHFQLTADTDEIIALGDPTLFALPHAHDFSAKIWTKIPTPATPDFRWHDPPRWLPLDSKNLGTVLNNYLLTNAAALTPLQFKPEPEVDIPAVSVEAVFPTNSALQISGALAQRTLLSPIAVPTLALPDVIAPSRVQLLVLPDGTVFSAVLLESCLYADASIKPDQLALQLANAAQFAPADQLMFGEMIFKWHTKPVAASSPLRDK